MTWLRVFWDLEPGGNAEHVAEHGLDMDDVEHVLGSTQPQQRTPHDFRIHALGRIHRGRLRRAGRRHRLSRDRLSNRGLTMGQEKPRSDWRSKPHA